MAEPSPNGNGRHHDPDELRRMELVIMEGSLPAPIPPEIEARLRAVDPVLARALDVQAARCQGHHPGGVCTPNSPCSECQAYRRYLAIVLHRERYGRVPHPSEVAHGDAWEGDQLAGDLSGAAHVPGADLGILLSAVRPVPVDWLWAGRIPLGKITVIDGDPGLGKSVLSLDLAARVSTGSAMPDGSPGRRGGVVLLSAEDGLDDTIRPRLDAAGADVHRILALDCVPGGADQGKRLPELPYDVPALRAAVQRMGALLVIVDPLMAYLGERVNSHRDGDCRRALFPLAELAQITGAAVVVIRHLNKAGGNNPIYRGGGSIGIIGAARSGLLVARDPDNPDRRILAATKSNLARLPASLAYDLSTAPDGALRIGWMGESPHTAESLLAAGGDDEDRDALAEAVEVLRAILPAGIRRRASEVRQEARAAGVEERTIRRAKAALGVRSERQGFGPAGEWYWFT
jgi:hypothetical protein